MRFSEWINTDSTKKQNTEEMLFESIVGIKVPSVNTFASFLLLHKKIKGFVKQKNKKPISVFDLSPKEKVNYLIREVYNIKQEVQDFNKKYN